MDLPKRSWVKISRIRTLAVERIGDLVGEASIEELAEVVEEFGASKGGCDGYFSNPFAIVCNCMLLVPS